MLCSEHGKPKRSTERLRRVGTTALPRRQAAAAGSSASRSGPARRRASAVGGSLGRAACRGGRRALKKAGRAGRKPRLKAAELRRIERGLKRGPQALGYETGLWTAWRVAHLIESECGVRYHPSQAWRILRQLGWSCQRPVGRALERDEEKSANGNGSAGRGLKKSPKRKAYHRLRRRKRTERAPAPHAHLGTERANAGAAVPLHLEDAFRHGRNHLLEFLFPAVSRGDSQSADHRVSGAPASAYSWQAADRVGRLACPSQPRGVGVRASAAEGASGWSFFPLTRRN